VQAALHLSLVPRVDREDEPFPSSPRPSESDVVEVGVRNVVRILSLKVVKSMPFGLPTGGSRTERAEPPTV
jgi:hypothetical protein